MARNIPPHWANGQHEYEQFLKQNSIRHTRIKPRTPQSNGIVERFNRTLLEEFYQYQKFLDGRRKYALPLTL
ncbi:MAG: integrase core domain-containing protein [Atribacterota bacterium]|nr:integrase core domain-containing protein [Atribacterota bacterium]